MGFLGLVVEPNTYYCYSGKIHFKLQHQVVCVGLLDLVSASQPAELGLLIRVQAQLYQPLLPHLASMLAI